MHLSSCRRRTTTRAIRLAAPQEPTLGADRQNVLLHLQIVVAQYRPLLRLLVPFYSFAVTFIVLVSVGTEGSSDFYRAASSIIPTLLLTLAVGGRFFLPGPTPALESPRQEYLSFLDIQRSEIERRRATLPPEEVSRTLEVIDREQDQTRLYLARYRVYAEKAHRLRARIFGGVVLLLLGAGEAAALVAIASENESPTLFALACGAITAGFAGVAVLAFAGPVAEEPLEAKTE